MSNGGTTEKKAVAPSLFRLWIVCVSLIITHHCCVFVSHHQRATEKSHVVLSLFFLLFFLLLFLVLESTSHHRVAGPCWRGSEITRRCALLAAAAASPQHILCGANCSNLRFFPESYRATCLLRCTMCFNEYWSGGSHPQHPHMASYNNNNTPM